MHLDFHSVICKTLQHDGGLSGSETNVFTLTEQATVCDSHDLEPNLRFTMFARDKCALLEVMLLTANCCAGIGFSAPGVSLNRLPGWEPHSYGYHGDDGMAFESCGTGKSYGPVFATGLHLLTGAPT